MPVKQNNILRGNLDHVEPASAVQNVNRSKTSLAWTLESRSTC